LGQMPVQQVPMMQPVQAPKPSAKVKPAATVVPPPPKPVISAPPASPKPAEPTAAAPVPPVASTAEGTPLKAPMPGMIISFEKKVGDAVNQGETVVILEAMKMENALPAPAGGTVRVINFKSGDSVAKNDVLCIIG
jgi:pyruvate carboxylase subunit B